MESANEPASRSCSNCGAQVPIGGAYCPNCGQRYTGGRVTVRQLFAEFADAVFNFDSKIFLTLRDLLIPGKLTEQYFLGRRKRYLAPIRLLFVGIIVYLATISYLAEDRLAAFFQQTSRERQQAAYQQLAEERLDTLRATVAADFPAASPAQAALDTLYERFAAEELPDSISNLPYIRFRGLWPVEMRTLKVAYKDMETLPADSLLNQYEVTDWKSRLVLAQTIKLLHESTNFTRYLLGQLTWMILLMMPALALLLKLLYVRRDFYYIEHLVFSFHYHAFAFLILSAGLLLDEATDSGFSPSSIAFLIVLIYLYLAMRRVYQQGRFKTFIKFLILNNGYLFLLTVFLIATLLVSALMF